MRASPHEGEGGLGRRAEDVSALVAQHVEEAAELALGKVILRGEVGNGVAFRLHVEEVVEHFAYALCAAAVQTLLQCQARVVVAQVPVGHGV